MELDTFLATPRWEIIRIITEKPSSPMEISSALGTTISFASQQLKLLEASGIVKKSRTGLVERGKPRSLFSISKESVYMVPMAKGISEKKLIPLSVHKKITIKIWSIESEEFQIKLERFFWSIEKHLEFIDAIAVEIRGRKLRIHIISKESNLTHEINEAQRKLDERLPFLVSATTSTLSKLESEHLVQLFDPKGMLEKNLKGGLNKDE